MNYYNYNNYKEFLQNPFKYLQFMAKYGNIYPSRKFLGEITMNYNKEILENSEIKYVVEADSSAWQNAIREAYNKSKHKFNIEGFRKGKAPMSVITRMYGVGVFFDDALDIILQDLYVELLSKETDLKPVARPNVEIVAISDTDLKVAFIVTVAPEFTLGEYKGLKLDKINADVTDEMVAEEITKAQEKAGAWENVTDRPCQKFDTVVIDYSGSVNGVKFEGGTAEKQNLELGSGMFIPGFEEQVEGMKIGDEKDINVKFPEEYAEDLAGKDAVFAVKLHEIKKKVLPEVNDDFAKDVSEFDTVEEYKADIKAKLIKTAEEKANRDMENALLDKIADNTEINIPDVMIEEQIEEMINEFEYRLSYQGLKPEDYYKYTNSSRDELRLRYNEPAQKQVKMRLIIAAIVKAENIKAEEVEIEAKIADFAKGANKSVEDYKKTMHPEQANYIENEIVMNKMIDFLMANNKFA